MIGDRSGYPLHYYSTDLTTSEDVERTAQVFQHHLIQSVALHELPPDVDNFVGRSSEVQQILALVDQRTWGAESKPIVVCMTGRAGVGKSALALHLAHRLRTNFLDGQFYVNLRGTEQQTWQPNDITTSLLRAWGVAETAIPANSHDRSTVFQSTFTNKRILLVLDNANEESQIHSLIPVQATGIVLITSRNSLALENTINLNLTELSETEAIELLHKLVNRDVIHLTMDIAKTIVDLCHCLPLAIYLTAGTVKNKSSKALTDYVDRLRQEHQRITNPHLNYADVRPSFTLNYQQLEPMAAQLLRFLGLLTNAHFTLSLAAALLEVDEDTAKPLVKQLVDLKFVKRIGDRRYQVLHDGVRLFVRGQLAAEETAETRQAARLRVSRWYATTCKIMLLGVDLQTRSHLTKILNRTRQYPALKAEQQLADEVLNWFEAERFSILTAIEWAVQSEDWESVVALAKSLALFFTLHAYWQDYERTHHLALEANRHLANRCTEAELLNNLGNAYIHQNKLDRAEASYKHSLALFREMGAVVPTAKTLTNLGALNLHRGRSQTAMMAWKEALNYLPDSSSEQQQLKQWMQNADSALWQMLTEEMSDRTASRGLFQSVGKVIKRFLSED